MSDNEEGYDSPGAGGDQYDDYDAADEFNDDIDQLETADQPDILNADGVPIGDDGQVRCLYPL